MEGGDDAQIGRASSQVSSPVQSEGTFLRRTLEGRGTDYSERVSGTLNCFPQVRTKGAPFDHIAVPVIADGSHETQIGQATATRHHLSSSLRCSG